MRVAQSDGRIRIKVPGHDGWPRESGWRLLIGYDVDATARSMLSDIGWPDAK